jgi:hypothetical protein
MKAPFNKHMVGVDAPALGAFHITPSDNFDMSAEIRAVTIGGAAGTLRFIGRDGEVNMTGTLLPGSYPLFARRILATGTTATELTGWV